MASEKIEKLTADYATARNALDATVRELLDEQEATKRRYMPAIKEVISAAANALTALEAEIKSNPSLFQKPKTQIISGIKVGYAKQKGKMVIVSDAGTIKLIRKHLPDQEATLIKVAETPVKTALAGLSGSLLKKIGVTMEKATDAVVIKPISGDIEKLVDALLKAETPDTEPEDSSNGADDSASVSKAA